MKLNAREKVVNVRHVALGMAVSGLVALSGCTAGGTAASAAADTFVGSEKCATCHQGEFKTWKDTYHSKMVRPASEGLLKDAADNWAKDSKGNAGPAKGNIDGKAYALADVQLVVGSKWKQRFLVKNPATGYHQFLDKQWNSYTRLWEGYGQKNDWETQCTTCHVTGYKVTGYDEKTNSVTKASFAEKNIGCEACHGPGGAHVATGKKADIFNPKNASKAEADKVCGYCHIRVENYQFKTGQGNASEQLPHPVIGQTYRAGKDDWTKWYTEKVLLVGIQADDPVNKNYPKTDLNDAFFLDDAAQKSGLFEARKHHQQYQEHLMTKHAKSGMVGCSDCHSPHSVKGKTVNAVQSCQACHGDKYDARAMMPGLGRTAGDLYMRAHTFNPTPRKGGPTSSDLKEPVYAPKR